MVKLSDYGLPVVTYSNERQSSQFHLAPEAFDSDGTMKSDVWSLGVTLITMTKMDNPLKCLALSKADYQCCNRDSPAYLGEKWSAELADFVEKCLVWDVSKRWSVEQLMEVSLFYGD